MKYALIVDNKVELISYEPTEGFVEVNDNVFADMIKKSDGSFNYTDAFLAEQAQYKTEQETKKSETLANKQSAIAKLKALGLDEEEVKAILGV
jgi:DNA-binding transcriptional regulator YhcF (GntR family)